MLGIIRGEVAVGGSGHDNSKASVFKQLFKSHCNTEVDILFHDAGGGNLTGILPPWPGSITITVELVFLPVFFARAQTPLPR